jgi:hypothetical protein
MDIRTPAQVSETSVKGDGMSFAGFRLYASFSGTARSACWSSILTEATHHVRLSSEAASVRASTRGAREREPTDIV